MELLVDLHIHSHFSRATSPEMNLSCLYRYGKIKGINIIGTGDFTHPAYFKEIKEKLEPAENGLFKLKDEFARGEDRFVPQSCKGNLIRFVPTVEISSIYSKAGRVRKVHNLIVAPDLKAVTEINARLAKIGNLTADGRPILGLDSKELLKITLASDPRAFFIPAHIWTPWFSIFGSKSGFNSLQEAFEELTPEIKALETGLSSDPFMNWRWSNLDGITLISNSDAHSPGKLAREANVLDITPGYDELINAIKTGDERFKGTIEFFPDEGKYHLDGHRLCKIRFTPEETRKHKGICPVCGKALVIGVENRVEELADRDDQYKPKNHKQVEYIIPLSEIISEIVNVKSTSSAKVKNEFERICTSLGDEFSVLRKIPIDEMKAKGFPELAEGIRRMRGGFVHIEPGYDGVYGIIKVFAGKSDRLYLQGQTNLL